MTYPTLAGELRRRAARCGDEEAIAFTEAGDEGVTERWSWSRYWQRCEGVAAGLRARGLGAGDRVLVLAPDVRAAVAAHFGAWAIGAVPTHVGLPYRLGDPAAFVRGLRATADRLRSRALLVSATLAPFVPADERDAVSIEGLLDEPVTSPVGDPDALPPPELVQLTSGSTGRPRAVVVPHARLLAHLDAIAQGLPASADDRGVTWLPLHHDMGLVGGLLYPFFTGFPVHVLSPMAFQAQPFAWLRAMADARATHTAAPPSAYALLLRLAPRAAREGLRLDRLRCAMVGAEPVSPDLLRRVGDALAPCGLRREAFFPVYGLAEATVAVTFPRVMSPAKVERVDRAALEDHGRVEPAGDGPCRELLGLGAPLRGTEVELRDAAGEALPERRVGEICVRAPSLMTGYDGEPEATAAALRDGWLHTGDLGFVSDGALFVTGRLKDLIIKGGHNLHPEPIEARAATVEGVRAGCVVAVGLRADSRETERLVVVAESRLDEGAWAGLAARVRESLKADGVAVDEVRVVAPGSLPKTTSGKLRRREVAALLAQRAWSQSESSSARPDTPNAR